MGFAPAGRRRSLAVLVRHHLLLPDTATRRDLDDPATIDRVAATIGGDAAVLQLLHALAQADGAATSASAWSPWKAHLVAALVARVQAQLGGGPTRRAASRCCTPTEPQVTAPPEVRAGAVTVGIEDVADGQQVTIGAPDRPGLLSTCAGVLALNQLDVRAAKMSVEDGHGDRRCSRCGRASGGRRCRRSWPTACARRWRARCRWPTGCASGRPTTARTARRSAPPRISWHNGEVSGAATGIVEVRAGDRAGLLYRLTAAIAAEGLDVTSARIETLGADAVDSFYVVQPLGLAGRRRAARAGRRRARGAATGGRRGRRWPHDTPG